MTLSAVVPVALLSWFPHQEPRFLIPILMPLVYLHGMTILPEADHTLIEASKTQIHGGKKLNQPSFTLLKLWFFINTLLVIFYGFLHQGGVFQATSYLYKDLKTTPLSVKYHIVTTYMYSLPESFLMQLPSDRLLMDGNKRYNVDKRVHLYEEGSRDMNYISQKLANILKAVDKQSTKNEKVYLLIAGSLTEEFEYTAKKHKLRFKKDNTFFPHLSLEAFPNLSRYCIEPLNFFYDQSCNVMSVSNYIWYISNMFKLNLYKISQKEISTIRNVINENEFM